MSTFNQFTYGSYTHPPGEIAFAGIQRAIVYSPTQRRNILRETWNLKGKIVKQGSDSQSQLFAAYAQLRTAYSSDGGSAGFAGTPFWLDNGNAIGGIIVTQPISHGEIKGAEGVTFLNYTLALQKDSFLSKPDHVLSYSEQVTFKDCVGRPLQVWRMPLTGGPIVQNVSETSWYEATQSGSGSSRTPSLQPEDPLWPDSLLQEQGARQVTYSSPKMQRGVPIEYHVEWSYTYRQTYPFTGGPHARG